MKGIGLLAVGWALCLMLYDRPANACLPVIPSDDLTGGSGAKTTAAATTTTPTTTTTSTVTTCPDATPLLTIVPVLGATKFVLSSTAPTPVGGSITVQCLPDGGIFPVIATTIIIAYNLLTILPPIPSIPPGAVQNARNAPGGFEMITMTCTSSGNWFVQACTGIAPICISTNGFVGQNIGGLGQIICQSFPPLGKKKK